MKKKLFGALLLFAAFILWTFLVAAVDTAPIGPEGSVVGFSTVNGFVYRLVGTHPAMYELTDGLSVIPIGFAFGFALTGFCQLVRRRSLKRVDRSILAMGGCLFVTAVVFLLFEVFPINYRPVLIDGALEASYPSSTTLLVLAVMPISASELKSRLKRPGAILWGIYLFTAFMVAGRMISGVHWFTDIVGGVLASGGIVKLYEYVKTRD